MIGFILLEDIEFYAYHGVFEQENRVGNTFILNLKISTDMTSACTSDELDGTISYAGIYNVVEAEMQIPSKLLEHVAFRIIKSLRVKFEKIEDMEIKISKKNPPVGGQVKQASILLIDRKDA